MRNAHIKNLNKTSNKLILLTSEFPYGTGETFLENEFPYLVSRFSEVVIFSESNKGESRIKNPNIEVKYIKSFNWKLRIKVFFKSEFYRELKYLNQIGKLKASTFRTVWYSMSKALSISKQLEKIVKRNESIVLSYWLDEKAIALALLKKENPDIKVFARAHGWDVYEERHPCNYLPYRNLTAENLDAVYTISENGKSYLLTRYPAHNGKIQTSRLGTMPLESLPEKIKSDSIHILSVSSIIPLKRVEKILEVVSNVPNLKIKWTHIGCGSEFEEIKEIAIQKSQQNQNFSFEFLGQLNNSKVRDILATHYFDLFVNLSETEGIPVTIMEAQSSGTTVLATNVGGTSEIVNNENGFLVEKDFNQEDVVYIIQKYLSSTDGEIQQKRNASYNNWKQNYNAETNYNEFVKLILSGEVPKAETQLH
jgi:colanic acid/amylovoran biosynthesis glycosyltransferase